MGDIPFYVGIDSLDVWSAQEAFLLKKDGTPSFIAGVPPDYFSATGQRWGNPIYNWAYLKKTGYQFWLDRIAYNSKLFDIIRIDHFRAFDTYWKIPASCETAIEGKWVEAPGYEVLDLILKTFPNVEIIAEDLGDLRPEVHVLKEHFHLKGMNILQFNFDIHDVEAFYRIDPNTVIYTGSHDNQPIKAWYRDHSPGEQRAIRRALAKAGYLDPHTTKRFLRLAMDSSADIAILPMQDILHLGEESRTNLPGTLGSPNWEWKMTGFTGFTKELPFLKESIAAGKRENRQEG